MYYYKIDTLFSVVGRMRPAGLVFDTSGGLEAFLEFFCKTTSASLFYIRATLSFLKCFISLFSN